MIISQYVHIYNNRFTGLTYPYSSRQHNCTTDLLLNSQIRRQKSFVVEIKGV